MKLKISIVGCRGIPNHYGGFEQFAEELSVRLTEKGHEIYVYNSSLHPYRNSSWNGVNIIHCADWEDKLGAAGQFIYDWNCFADARKRNFDIILQLGYTSSSIWYWRWPKNAIHLINMDGLEWKRTQYSKPVRRFIRYAEALAAKHANVLVADSKGIQSHILETYNKPSFFIPYGAEIFNDPEPSVLNQFSLIPNDYYLAVARLEPENNIEMLIKGYLRSKMEYDLVIVGRLNEFSKQLKTKYDCERIRFIDAVYNKNVLNNLRYYSVLHFHGHSVGGTNPSLLEAMACQANIVAHNNIFNKAILGADAAYFTSPEEISRILDASLPSHTSDLRKKNNLRKIFDTYNWDIIADSYEQLMLSTIGVKPKEPAVRESRQIA